MPQTHFVTSFLTAPSFWILAKYWHLQKNLSRYLQSYQMAYLIEELYTFLWDYFADWYVEYLKTDASQLAFAKELFRQYIVLLSPYAPFETQVLWQEFFGEAKLLIYEKVDNQFVFRFVSSAQELEQKAQEFASVIRLVEEIRSLRGLFAIPNQVWTEVYTENPLLLDKYSRFLKLVARSQVLQKQQEQSIDNYYTLEVATESEISDTPVRVFIDILRYVTNKEEESARSKQICQKLAKQIAALEAQLNNPQFLQKAEPEIVQQKRQDLQNCQQELKRQEQKLSILENS